MHRTTPIRRSLRRATVLLALLAFLAASCGDDGGAEPTDDTTTSTTTTTLPATTAPIPEEADALVDLRIEVVEFGPDGYVEISNNGDGDVDLNGIYSCSFPNYEDLGTVVDGGMIAAGESVRVPADIWGGLDAADGETALYQGNTFEDSDTILAYVQWGTGGHQRASVAAAAGIWPSSDATVAPDSAFNSIESGGDPADPENWS